MSPAKPKPPRPGAGRTAARALWRAGSAAEPAESGKPEPPPAPAAAAPRPPARHFLPAPEPTPADPWQDLHPARIWPD